MSDAKAPQEPSMEEILASIRRIISEDSDGPKADAAPHAAAAPAPAAPPPAAPPSMMSMELDQDILDLTQRADPMPEPAPQAPQPEALFEFEQEGDIDADEINVPEVDFSEGLMSRASANAAEDAFARLSTFDESAPMMMPGSVPASANGVLEALVKDALKPVLKAWLDDHLPPMVEELVRQEIQRLAQAGRRR
jgi:cell pole-organizing protein PopZ